VNKIALAFVIEKIQLSEIIYSLVLVIRSHKMNTASSCVLYLTISSQWMVN